MLTITIDSKDSLDAFASRVAPHTNIPKTRLKTAIARAYQFDHIKALEAALGKSNMPTPPQTLTPIVAPVVSENASMLTTIRPEDMKRLSALYYWLEENSTTYIDSDGHVNAEMAANELANVLHARKQGSQQSMPEQSYDILCDLVEWLQDNVDGAYSITFEDGFTSDDVIASLERLLSADVVVSLERLLGKGSEAEQVNVEHTGLNGADSPLFPTVSKGDVLEWAGVGDVMELDAAQYENSEDALLNAAGELIGVADQAKLADVLTAAGMGDVLETLKALAWAVKINALVSELV